MAKPLVSVIIPAYNSARSIGETIESALGQTHTRREIIVVDDGSTDGTAARLEPYGPSIHYVRQDHREVGAARNTGLRRASGDSEDVGTSLH